MAVFEQNVCDVAVHCNAAGALRVVPGNVNARKFGSRPVSGDLVGFFECGKQVVCVSPLDVLNAKVVDDEDKYYRPPSMSPESGRSFTLVVSMCF